MDKSLESESKSNDENNNGNDHDSNDTKSDHSTGSYELVTPVVPNTSSSIASDYVLPSAPIISADSDTYYRDNQSRFIREYNGIDLPKRSEPKEIYEPHAVIVASGRLVPSSDMTVDTNTTTESVNSGGGNVGSAGNVVYATTAVLGRSSPVNVSKPDSTSKHTNIRDRSGNYVALGDDGDGNDGVISVQPTVLVTSLGPPQERFPPDFLPPLSNIHSACCCIIALSDMTMESSSGVQTTCHLCCYEHSAAFCRPKGERCYMAYGNVGLSTTLSGKTDMHLQLCPLHVFLCHPLSDLASIQNVALVSAEDGGVAENNKAVPCAGYFFSVHSCFCKFPQCLSAFTKLNCLCFRVELINCRPSGLYGAGSDEGMCCICARGQVVLETPKSICKGLSQCFCCDNRFALPCDEEVPCLFFLLPFCTVCVNGKVGIHCCHSLKQLVNLHSA